MSSNIYTFTPTGKIKKPSYSTVATWVKKSWDKVSDDLIQRSFKCCGISTKTDNSEDDCLFDYDNLLDQESDIDDEETVEDSNISSNHKEYPEEDHYKNNWNVKTNNNNVKEKEDDEKREGENNTDEEYSSDEEIINVLRKKFKTSREE